MARTCLRGFWCASISLAALAVVSPAAAQDDPDVKPVAANQQASGNTIVVTGLRRADQLQDTPAAITAFTADTIENARILKPADFTGSTLEYKSGARAAIEDQGYRIVENVGDQFSDLAGGHAIRGFKYANPFDFLP